MCNGRPRNEATAHPQKENEMLNSTPVRLKSVPEDVDFVSHNIWLHSRLVLAVTTDTAGNHVHTQIALVSDGGDVQPVLHELAYAFAGSIGADEMSIASRAIDMREQFADAFLRLAEELRDEANVTKMLNGLANEVAH